MRVTASVAVRRSGSVILVVAIAAQMLISWLVDGVWC